MFFVCNLQSVSKLNVAGSITNLSLHSNQ
jgi:hypothetical protein